MSDARPQSDSAEPLSADPRLRLAERPPCSADDEPMGGDPPCWAHLFEDDDITSDR